MTRNSVMARLIAVKKGSGRGQALGETAIAMTLLLIILLGALDMGRCFYAYISIVNAAREGARNGAVLVNPGAVNGAVTGELAGNPTIDVSKVGISSSGGARGGSLTVTVNYPFDLLVTSFLPFSTIDLRSTATMMVP